MTEWTKEEATPELRYFGPWLQQKWRITTGSGGKVEYREEWRDVPVVEEAE